MAPFPMAKQIRISFRRTPEFTDRIQAASKRVGLGEPFSEAEAIKAVISHFGRFGRMTIPVRLEEPTDLSGRASVGPEISQSNKVTGLNESPGHYPAKRQAAMNES